MKLPCGGSIAFAASVDRDADRFGVDLAHEFADELFLSIEPAVFGNAACEHHCILEVFRYRQRIEFVLRQIDQRFAEFLQIVALALAQALARPFIRNVIVFFNHARIMPRSPVVAPLSRRFYAMMGDCV